MNEIGPKVEFALGSQVSPGQFFKSSFARSIVTNCRDAKSLDLELANNGTNVEESAENKLFFDGKNNNFFSLITFGASEPLVSSNGPQSSTWQAFNETSPNNQDLGELEKLRKQCQALTEENRRLAESLQASQGPHTQMIDTVLLQTQIETLQWQLKQTEQNRQMYRSLMGQIVRFLERARKSLDILHKKNNPKGGKISRVPRSRSVQGINGGDDSIAIKKREKDIASTSINNRPALANSGGSRFNRAKSVAQISPQPSSSIRDFTWSVLRKNDPGHCTPPRNKTKQQIQLSTSQSPASLNDITPNKAPAVYTRPEYPAEIDPDDVPPEKLSQEAFRLMRTVQSLLAMREPDLSKVSGNEEEAMFVSLTGSTEPASLRNLRNSSANDATSSYGGCWSSDRGSPESGGENIEKANYASLNGLDNSMSSTSTLQTLVPRARRSIDATSINSNSESSSKTTEEEEEEDVRNLTSSGKPNVSAVEPALKANREVCPPTSTPTRRVVNTKNDKKQETSRWLRAKIRPKSARSGSSSAEDESGFSSMSSFQEVGLPLQFVPTALSPIKGCHTEVGLPEIPIEKIPHRRWSSTPAEFAAIFKRHSTNFTGSTSANPESLSVWV